MTGDGVEEGDTQWVTDPETGEPGVSRMNADEMNAIADELSGTAIQLNATTTMSGGDSKRHPANGVSRRHPSNAQEPSPWSGRSPLP